MSMALDAGSSEMRSLRTDADQVRARRCPSVYALLDDTEPHRSSLQQMDVPFARCDGQLVLFGPGVERCTQLFRIPQRQLFSEGRVPEENPPARQLLANIVEALIGRAEPEGQPCALIIPPVPTPPESSSRDSKRADASCGEFLRHLVELQGYAPLPLSAPHALVLAELATEAFTGIGMTFGAGTSEAALVHRGNELAHCATPFAGNWVDVRVARADELFLWDAQGNKHLDTAAARSKKESLAQTGPFPESFPGGDSSAGLKEPRLRDLFRGMIEFLLQQAATRFSPVLKQFRIPGPMTAVVSGGSTRLPGFRNLLEDALGTVSFPVPLSEFRIVESDLAVAQGGLIRAELEAAEDAAEQSAQQDKSRGTAA